MRRAAFILAITALLVAPATVFAAEPFSATLTPDAEVPAATVPDGYSGSGSASATISDDETEVAVEVTCDGLTGALTGSHIHYGAQGAAGPVMLPIDHTDGCPLNQTLTEADFVPVDGGPQNFAEALDAIRGGMTYINLHTEQNAPGEIRGQLESLPDTAAGAESQQPAGSSSMIVLLLIGVGAFLFGLRRFSFRRA